MRTKSKAHTNDPVAKLQVSFIHAGGDLEERRGVPSLMKSDICSPQIGQKMSKNEKHCIQYYFLFWISWEF